MPTLQDDVPVSLNGRVVLVRILQLHFGNTSPQTVCALQFVRHHKVPTDQPTERRPKDISVQPENTNQECEHYILETVTEMLLIWTCRRLGWRPSRNWVTTASRKYEGKNCLCWKTLKCVAGSKRHTETWSNPARSGVRGTNNSEQVNFSYRTHRAATL